jgi:hypothetical protein
MKGFEFPGSIDNVRIYSLALTKAQVLADMHGTGMNDLLAQRTEERGVDSHHRSGHPKNAPCAALSDLEDAKIPGIAGALGVLVAVACVGFYPASRSLLCLVVSLAAGLLLLPVTVLSLPSFNLWMIPLLSLIGGASVVVSVSRQSEIES